MQRMVMVAATVLLASFAIGANELHAQQPARASDQPYVVEYYYKTRWGFAAEFIRLFKKNHYPVLAKQIESGRIVVATGGGWIELRDAVAEMLHRSIAVYLQISPEVAAARISARASPSPARGSGSNSRRAPAGCAR